MIQISSNYKPEEQQVTGWVWPAAGALFAVGLLTVVYAHFRVAGSDTYTGLLAPLDRLFDLALAAAISLILASLGLAISRLLHLAWANTAETISISLFLGTGVFGLAVLGLGLLGLLTPIPILILCTLSIIFSRTEIRQIIELSRRGVATFVCEPELRLPGILFLCLMALLLFRTATPPYIFDEAIYHLPVTREFVDQGRIFPNFNNSMGNQPFLIHMIYALCLMAGSDIAAKFFGLALSIATGLALYGFCQRYVTRRVALLAVFVFFAAGMVTEVAVTTRVDVSVAGMLFVATYAMINYLQSGARNWLWTSALLAGFSLGVKHSAALWLLLIGALYLIESVRSRRASLLNTLKYGIVYVVIAFAVASPWYAKNYVWFGNPFYPFFTGEVASYGPDGLRYFNSEDERKLDAHFTAVRNENPELVKAEEETITRNAKVRPERHPMRPWEVYINPDTYLMAEARHFPNYLFLVLPLSFFMIRTRWLAWLLALSICYFLMATWSSWIARYLLPAYPALSILSAFTLATSGDWLKRRIAPLAKLPVYLVAVALTVVVATNLKSVSGKNALGFIAGNTSRRDFMRGFSYYQPVDFINTELPADARIMSIGAQMIYGIQRPCLTDETWYATKWRRLLVHNDSLDQVHQELKRQGVNYVLFDPGLFQFAAVMGLEQGQVVPPVPRPLAAKVLGIRSESTNEPKQNFEEAQRLGKDFPLLRNWATFEHYTEKYLEPVYTDKNGYRIYRVL
ncbi:MAG TPA: glycosyltransferase family 39 protein [Pyrinomonadaceae bacterium]|nr:glycosyltransferase family 39 protein [Pyrinomonadaceae bacterium]